MLRVIVSIVLAWGLLSGAMAQNVFTVSEVPVAAEAESAALAQRIARDEGRKIALDTLLRRLVAEQDWDYLPTLATGQPSPLAGPEADDAVFDPYAGDTIEERDPFGSAFSEPADPRQPISISDDQVRRFELETNVFNEKSSGTTYRAQITYRFKPDEIRGLLRAARIPYSEEQAREVLIVPVLATATDTYLWESKNPWARAWLERPRGNELTPMVLPVGDVLDIQALTAEEAQNLNAAALRVFQERYDGIAIYLALASLEERSDEFFMRVRLVDATPPNIDNPAPGPSTIGRRILEMSFTGATDDFPVLARGAVASIVDSHAATWKQRTRVDYGMQRTFDLTAWYREQRELSHIQDAIAGSALVIDINPGPLSNGNAAMTLTVVGEENQFRLAMRERDLEVWRDAADRWHIAELDFAEELMAREGPLRADIVDEQNERGRRGNGLGRFFRRGQRNDNDRSGDDRSDGDDDDIPELPDDLFGDEDGR